LVDNRAMLRTPVLVTGATGFLGQHLVLRLLRDGEHVRVLARSATNAKGVVEAGAELVLGELTDSDAVRTALQGVSVVYHVAGKLFAPGVPPATYRHVHVDGTRALLDLCRDQAQLARFVHCSTTGVLGITGDLPVDENEPYRPTNLYEQTKAEAEQLVDEARRRGLPTVTVRPGLVYGPGDLHLLGLFRAINRGVFRPIGRRPISLHPIYISDMTEAFVRCGHDARAIGECFHIAGREPVTIARLATTIAAALGVRPPVGEIPLSLARFIARAGDALPANLRQRAPLTRSRLDFLTHSRVYDVAKARATIDFAAATDFEAGIERTVDWYRSEGHLPAARWTLTKASRHGGVPN
jgi:nucleoside-diphosphate-sugar epimerase